LRKRNEVGEPFADATAMGFQRGMAEAEHSLGNALGVVATGRWRSTFVGA
jgi:hypothetical protein